MRGLLLAVALVAVPALAVGPVSAGAPASAVASGAGDGYFASRTRGLMGTRFQILAFVADAAQEAALDAALDRVAALERRWSPWIEGSDISRVNAAPAGEATRVAPDTAALLRRSLAICEATGRAFDPTFFALAPLYDLRDPDLGRRPTTRSRASCPS